MAAFSASRAAQVKAFFVFSTKMKNCCHTFATGLGCPAHPCSTTVANQAFSDMIIALPIRPWIPSPIFHLVGNRRSRSGSGLLQVLRNPSEWKCAVTVALIFFVASLTLAPALTRDQKSLASEINTKTLKAAAAIQTSSKPPLRVQN